MIALMLSTALGGPLAAAPQSMTCEISEAWSRLDEAVLDHAVTDGRSTVPVTMGCRHMGVPGAIIDVGTAPQTQGLQVVGMRRAQGLVFVAATAEQARALRGNGTAAPARLVRDGDWAPMIEAMERLRR